MVFHIGVKGDVLLLPMYVVNKGWRHRVLKKVPKMMGKGLPRTSLLPLAFKHWKDAHCPHDFFLMNASGSDDIHLLRGSFNIGPMSRL